MKYQDICQFTKGTEFSVIARTFDRLGLISPVLTKVNILMQTLWQLSTDWNDLFLLESMSEWEQFSLCFEIHHLFEVPYYCLI